MKQTKLFGEDHADSSMAEIIRGSEFVSRGASAWSEYEFSAVIPPVNVRWRIAFFELKKIQSVHFHQIPSILKLSGMGEVKKVIDSMNDFQPTSMLI